MNILSIKSLNRPAGRRRVLEFALLAAVPFAGMYATLGAMGILNPQVALVLGALAALCVLGATTLALIQAERVAGRLDTLVNSARRIARQDFSVAIPVLGSDELSQVTRAFNSMARHLSANFLVQGILARMDDAILTKLDVAALISSGMRCVQLVTQGDAVVLGLFDAEQSDDMRTFVVHKNETGRIENGRITLTADLKRLIPLQAKRATVAKPPFPKELEDRLRKEFGVGHYFVMPIMSDSRAWGVLVSCHGEATEISIGQFRTLSAVAARLIAGFSGAERDQKLHTLAYVDPLTGLPNRVALQSLLDRELTKAQRGSAMMAVLFIDLDRFKQANDTHGHAIGDRLLVQAANRIRSNVREDDVVARLGGDEFTVILPGIKSHREASAVARKLIQALSRRFEIEGHVMYTGASVGIAVFPEDGNVGADLLKKADTAMYRAKSEGRSRFAFFEEPMNAESRRRSMLDTELRNALERHELVLQYQPQIDLKTGALCGVEALVRWQHPTRGLLYPRDFIDYAEEIGLIPEIGTWVLAEACRQHRRWREEGVRVPRVAVNVSNGQLPRSNFLSTVRQVLDATEMPPGTLEIEVTESMLVEGGKPAMDALNQLSADGVLIAIDDFGTGYSSFSYLKTMPAGVLKLDMSFLVDARVDNDAGKIVAAIINMAHALQKEVVAEGVEHVDQLKLLKTLGCERAQGYLFGKAVGADHITRTFRRLNEESEKPETAELTADGLMRRGARPPPPTLTGEIILTTPSGIILPNTAEEDAVAAAIEPAARPSGNGPPRATVEITPAESGPPQAPASTQASPSTHDAVLDQMASVLGERLPVDEVVALIQSTGPDPSPSTGPLLDDSPEAQTEPA